MKLNYSNRWTISSYLSNILISAWKLSTVALWCNMQWQWLYLSLYWILCVPYCVTFVNTLLATVALWKHLSACHCHLRINVIVIQVMKQIGGIAIVHCSGSSTLFLHLSFFCPKMCPSKLSLNTSFLGWGLSVGLVLSLCQSSMSQVSLWI